MCLQLPLKLTLSDDLQFATKRPFNAPHHPTSGEISTCPRPSPARAARYPPSRPSLQVRPGSGDDSLREPWTSGVRLGGFWRGGSRGRGLCRDSPDTPLPNHSSSMSQPGWRKLDGTPASPPGPRNREAGLHPMLARTSPPQCLCALGRVPVRTLPEIAPLPSAPLDRCPSSTGSFHCSLSGGSQGTWHFLDPLQQTQTRGRGLIGGKGGGEVSPGPRQEEGRSCAFHVAGKMGADGHCHLHRTLRGGRGQQVPRPCRRPRTWARRGRGTRAGCAQSPACACAATKRREAALRGPGCETLPAACTRVAPTTEPPWVLSGEWGPWTAGAGEGKLGA